MARNGLAGTKTGKSKSALFYAKNKASRLKKQNYDAKNNAKPKSKLYRARLAKANRDNPNSKVGDGLDVSHKKGGRLVLQRQSHNRSGLDKNAIHSRR